jgi:hypothetical protein
VWRAAPEGVRKGEGVVGRTALTLQPVKFRTSRSPGRTRGASGDLSPSGCERWWRCRSCGRGG